MKIFKIRKIYFIMAGLVITGVMLPVIYLFSAPANKSACCAIGTTYGSSIVNPAKGGDNDMFTIPGVPPNIIWLLDTSGSMRDIACGGNCDSVRASGFYRCSTDSKVYSTYSACNSNCAGSCNTTSPCGINGNTYLDAFTKFGYSWTQTTTANPYDADTMPGNSFEDQRDPQTPADGLFEAYRVYRGPSTGGSCGITWTDQGFDVTICGGSVNTSRYECNTTGTLYNSRNQCLNNCTGSCFLKPIAGNCNATCQACVNQIRERGFRYGGSGRYYFSGNLLNYYPPKYVVARKVLKDVIVDTRKIRMGLFRFDGARPPTSCNYCSDYGCGACIIGDLNPPCPLCLNEGAAYDNNRTSLINAINNMTIYNFNTNTPTAEALFNIGQYYSGEYSTVFGAGSVKAGLNPKSGANDSIAYSCMQNYAVVITDGLPTEDGNNYNLAGAVGDSDSDANPCDRYGSFYPDECPPMGTNGSGHLLDDVAYSIYNNDLRPSMTGSQKVVTYTVGFGTEMFGGDDLLKRAASNSTGLYFSASDPSGLADALKQVLEDVIRRATSYSNISAASIQVSSTSGAFIPRFFPSNSAFWKGYLYAFRQYNEPLTGINLNNDTDPETGQPDVTDQLIVDADTDIVTVDNNTGYPVKAKNGSNANEFWEAGRCLSDPLYKSGVCYTSSDERNIYTAVDLNNDGTIASNEQITFDIANLTQLKDYLALEGNNYCSDLSNRVGFTFPDATKVTSCAGFTDPTEYCACLLIQFVRGKDIFDEDTDGDRNDDRPWKLGDIFHSTPQMIKPPDKTLCTFDQCLRTLFQDVNTTGTELKMYGTRDAYDNLVELYVKSGNRDQVVLVGANDGMLHAFHAGDVILGDNPESVNFIEEYYFDQGTGKELWAFIPPDLLPKLKNLTYGSGTGKHSYFVDSTPWIRNIWFDANNNYIKECDSVGDVGACEFRTIMVSGERGGGTHFFALDVTNVDYPQFLWLFPQPCSEDSLKMGMTYAESLPQPPPIGPIKYIDPGNPNNGEFRERYVVFLNAGYDPLDLKGRGMFMLDAWTGEKIYEATYESLDPIKSNMKFSVTAPIYADAWKKDPSICGSQPTDNPYFWNIASFGDMGGQIFTLRFISPDPSRWYLARIFEQEDHLPFSYIAQTATIGGCHDLRIAVGTGDRENINACSGKDCKYNDVRSCLLEGCTNVSASGVQEIDGKRLQVSKSWSASILPNTDNFQITLTGNSACSDINYTVNPLEINGCPVAGGSPGGNDAESEKNAGIICTTPFSCTETANYDTLTIETGNSKPGYKFYAINYSKEFIDDPAKAMIIDAGRLSDSDLYQPPNASISASSDGWMLPYGYVDRQTASGAIVIGGISGDCIVWSAYEPNCTTGGTADPCYAPGAGVAYLYHASLSSGKEGCLKKTFPDGVRFVQLGTTIPPPPTVSYVIAGNKLYKYFVGGEWWNPMGSFGGESLIPGFVYWQEIPMPLHECKHNMNCQ